MPLRFSEICDLVIAIDALTPTTTTYKLTNHYSYQLDDKFLPADLRNQNDIKQFSYSYEEMTKE